MEENEIADYEIISDPEKRLAHEGDFLLWLMKIAPGRRILDMAAATGFHAQFLASHGAEVTARDMDKEAISYARERRAAQNITYEVADLREPKGGPFDLVILMGNTLSLLESTADVARAFDAAREQLAPRGVFFVHVVNYAALEAGGPRQKVARHKSGSVERVIVKNMVPLGEGAPTLVAFASFRCTDGRWRTDGSQSVLLDLRREFLRETAVKAGFETEGVYGDYNRSAFDEKNSPDLLLVLRKGE